MQKLSGFLVNKDVLNSLHGLFLGSLCFYLILVYLYFMLIYFNTGDKEFDPNSQWREKE